MSVALQLTNVILWRPVRDLAPGAMIPVVVLVLTGGIMWPSLDKATSLLWG